MPGATDADATGGAEADADDSGLATDLRQALARGDLSLAYQPIVDAKTRSLAGVEALARWNCPGRGFVPPDRFIPVAEAAGLIEAITGFVLRRAFAELAPLFARHPCLKLSINLAAHEVSPSRVGELLALLGAVDALPPNRLQFEITERTLLGDRADVHAALATLTNSGATVAIDDFGTGYSSLSYLDAYPIHCLKIDKSFVQRLDSSAPTRKLVEAILLMAGALDVRTVAEGVETIGQLAFLIGKGCRYIQGYLFSRPLPVAALEAFVADFRFPADLLDAALWPPNLALPRMLADNKEKALRLFFKHVPVEVAMFDTAMRYVAASARWLETYEIADTDVIGRCHYDVLPDTPQQWRDADSRCLAGETVQAEDDCFVHPDGRREWTASELRPMTNAAGDTIGIVVFSERITARKLAEQRQNESEQRLADFLATSSDWVWELDADLRVVARSAGSDLVNRNEDIGQRPWDFRGHEPGQDEAFLALRSLMEAGRPFRNLEFARRNPAGALRWREVSGQPVFGDDGRFAGYRGSSRDITARKLAEQRQQESEQRLADFLDTSSDWVWELDADLRFVAFSGSWDGQPRSADIGRRPWELHGPESGQDASLRAHIADLTARRPFRNFVCPRTTAAGEVCWNEVSGNPIFAGDGSFRGYRGTARDVTARQRTEAALRRKVVQLEMAGEMAGVGYWHWDATLRSGTWSDEILRIVGRDRATLRWDDDSRFEVFHPDDRQGQMDVVRAAILAREPFQHRARVLRPDGSIREVRTTGRPLLAEDGRLLGLLGVVHDITEQVGTAADLTRTAEENRIFRAIIETLPDHVFAKDRDGRFIAANAATLAAYGMSRPDELIGKNDYDLRDKESADRFWHEEQAMMREGRTWRFDHSMDVAGRRRDMSSIKAPLRDADGRVVGLVGCDRDVTEERRAQMEAKVGASGNELYRRVFESLPDSVFVKDLHGHFLLANDATARHMGVAAAADLMGRHDRDFHPPESTARLAADERDILATGHPRTVEESFPDATGGIGWKLSTKSIVRNADGSPFGIVGVEHDVGDLVRAREAAAWERQQNDLYRQGLELLPDLFFVKDLEHRFLVANHGLAAQVGAASAADVIGRTDDDFHAPHLARGYREAEAAVMAAGELRLVEEQARRADGTLGWFSTMKAPLRDATGKVVGLVGNGRDITEQKLAREVLQNQNEDQRRFAKTLAIARQEAEHAREMLSEAAMVMSDGFALFDPSDRLVLCNSRYSRGLGASTEDVVGLTFAELMRLPSVRATHALDDAGFAAWRERRAASHRAADGTPFELENHGIWVQIQERRTTDGSIVLSHTDITHLKAAQENLRQLASRDALTGLSNRRDFVEQASRRIAAGEWATMVLFDIDHFKKINDTYGHPAGDATLCQLARLCAGLLRPTDLLARWGGEEFVLLLVSNEPPFTCKNGTLQVVERLRSGIADLTVHSGRDRIRVTASFGVATCAGSSCVLETLIEQADQAMYRAKHAGRNRIELAVPAPGVLAGS
jgi:diguanylate cyclase (GGDEF)-like protein/PAS domain S-box-containing protein